MAYRLKANQPEFEMVDGPFARKGYKRNRVYEKVPPEHEDRFERIDEPKPARTEAHEKTGGARK